MSASSRQWLVCGVAGALMSTASPGRAQSAQPELEEVLVTAQRRGERLQDVPITVTVLDAEQVQHARVQQIGDVAIRTPGLSFDAYPASQPRVFIRGIGSSDRGAAGDPSAAVFLDEVYLGRPAAVAFDAFDVERIEVLKGPQGTLYGRNVVGGAINVLSRRADPSAFDAGAEVTVGNYRRLDGAAFVNSPLADGKAAIRASGSWRTHDGYVRNTFTGNRVEDQDTSSARLQLAGQPTDNLRLSLAVDGTRDRAAGPAQHVLDLDDGADEAVFWTVDRDRKHTAGATDGYQDRDTWGARVQVDWDVPFATLTYLGSHRDLDYSTGYDFDGGNAATNLIDIAGTNEEKSHFYSNELRMSSLPSARVAWVAGLYNFGSDTDRLDVLALNIAGDALDEIYTQHATLDSYAAFGDVTWPLTDRLSVTGGVRYSRDEKLYRVSNTAGAAIVRADERFDVTVERSYDAMTYRVGASFNLADDHLLYFMVSRGFKSGGFQDTPSSAADAADDFAPEYATQYEIGQKSTFADGALVWNNTLFLLDYTDLQTRRVLDNLAIVTDNAGEATIQGFETYVSWRAFAGARLTVSYAYTDATFDVFSPEPGVDYAGNRISRTPEHKVVVSPSYEWLLPHGATVSFAADYSHESKIFDDNSNTGPEFREPTHFVDARVIYTSVDERWSVSFWGKNLTDELTRTFQGTFLGANFGAYNPPRTYGATFSWNY
ncbi:TonB-dependent receptor [Steroidobacter sp. S1-65]|uniref:TonB-dependent receptor n=1 Tax=Steroidobacter gossypii TaxID=2805490 RepID=A0ABS1X063_9GAMM|nr:TonB-dependent receptor [Steroidobacter gossypii]MBM0106603.1 TonB-dependent receptor [Steroidobacter gossypii]